MRGRAALALGRAAGLRPGRVGAAALAEAPGGGAARVAALEALQALADEKCEDFVELAFSEISGINICERTNPRCCLMLRVPGRRALRGAACRAARRAACRAAHEAGGLRARRPAPAAPSRRACWPRPQPFFAPAPLSPCPDEIYADTCHPDDPPEEPVASSSSSSSPSSPAAAAAGRYRGALLGADPPPRRAAGRATGRTAGRTAAYPHPGRVPRYDPCIDNKVDVYMNKPEVRAVACGFHCLNTETGARGCSLVNSGAGILNTGAEILTIALHEQARGARAGSFSDLVQISFRLSDLGSQISGLRSLDARRIADVASQLQGRVCLPSLAGSPPLARPLLRPIPPHPTNTLAALHPPFPSPPNPTPRPPHPSPPHPAPPRPTKSRRSRQRSTPTRPGTCPGLGPTAPRPLSTAAATC